MSSEKALNAIAEISRRYGANADYAFLGGGNTSYKDGEYLYIKPSGVALATIQPEQFLKMERAALRRVFDLDGAGYPDALRERLVKECQLAAVRPEGAGRPSVEAPLHELIKYVYIVHTHPVLVNGMTCAVDAAETCRRLFPKALWVDYCNAGSTLAFTVRKLMDAYEKANGNQPKVVFLQNHGVFVSADTCEEIDALYADITATLTKAYAEAGVAPAAVDLGPVDEAFMLETAPRLRTLLADEQGNRAIVHTIGSAAPFGGPVTPDHIVYAKSNAYVGDGSAESLAAYKAEHGYMPKVLFIGGKLLCTAAPTLNEAKNAATAVENALRIEPLAKAFGGIHYMTKEQAGFIENWEVESYRRSVSGGPGGTRLANRVCVVTGGAQGFGLGIAETLIANGGTMVLADMNYEGAKAAAERLCAANGKNRADAVAVNVSNEESVQKMMTDIVRTFGGIDLFVSNAGVVRSGSVMELSLKDFAFVTDINYIGYFLCVKHAARIMAAQMTSPADRWTDIVQVNSKSGLEGSNKNGAYAGSKFGGIGLTQSFAKELVTSRIKVNSVCPGNYLDGPLWSDPQRGLFVQYLNAGKVPGAKSVEDVREFYMAKVPMHRGCLPADVARAIMYCVEQDYETGQAIPVTGGQNMLHA